MAPKSDFSTICREVLVHEPDSFVAAYVEHPGDYTWHEALEIAKERDQEAASFRRTYSRLTLSLARADGPGGYSPSHLPGSTPGRGR